MQGGVLVLNGGEGGARGVPLLMHIRWVGSGGGGVVMVVGFTTLLPACRTCSRPATRGTARDTASTRLRTFSAADAPRALQGAGRGGQAGGRAGRQAENTK